MYNTIEDALKDMENKGYVLIESFKDRKALDNFFKYYEDYTKRKEALEESLGEYLNKH